MDGGSGGVEISKFVDDWLTAIENAVDAASNDQLTANAKLYENKYVKDLVDALSKQLVRYIEHPDPSNPDSKIIYKRDRLMVSTDETPENAPANNVPDKTRRGRIKFIIMEILKRKGTDGGRRFAKLKDTIEQNLQIAPEELAMGAGWNSFNNTKLPMGNPNGMHFYYDPKNVDDDLRVKKIYGSRINLENIDQFMNNNSKFNKRMTNYFGKPDFRRVDEDLLKMAQNKLGKYNGPQNVQINHGDVEGVEENLNAHNLTTTPGGAARIANAAANEGTVRAVATEIHNNAEHLTTGAAPTQNQANAIAKNIVNGSNKQATNAAQNKTIKALNEVGLEPKSNAALRNIAGNPNQKVVAQGTNVAGTNRPPSNVHANLGAQAVQAAVDGSNNGRRASNIAGLGRKNASNTTQRANASVPFPGWVANFPTNGSRASNNAGTPRNNKRNNNRNRTVRAQQLTNSMAAEGFNRKNAKNNPFL